MSLIRQLTRRPETRSTFWPPALQMVAPSAGVDVTVETALRSAAVWACQRVLVATVAKMPVQEWTTRGNTRELVANVSPIVANPGGNAGRRAWVAQVIRSQLMAGNAYGDVVKFDAAMRPLQIETVHPSNVQWLMREGRAVPFVGGKPRAVWPEGDFWHVPVTQFMVPGRPDALSPSEFARTAVGTAIAAEQFGAQFFGDGAHPTALIYADKELTKEQADAVKSSFLNAIRGTREPAVFGSGLKYEQVQVDPKDSQFLELAQFEIEQAARFWGVPPAMIYSAVSGQHITYANVNQEDIQFLKHSVQAWVVDLEDAWSRLTVQGREVVFDDSAVLRMDHLAVEKWYQLRLSNHDVSVNEIRRAQNLTPWSDPVYDEPGLPGTSQQTGLPTSIGGAPND